MTAINDTLAGNTQAGKLKNSLRQLANNRLNSYVYDERKCISPIILLELGNLGIFGVNTPVAYQGLGLPNQDICQVMEQLGAIDLSLATLVINNNFLGIRPLIGFASQKLKQEWLPQFATGRKLVSYALTEPEAGSNPLNLKGRGLLQHGACHIHADKMWIGSAAWASLINTFVNAERAGGTKYGITCYTVPADTPGLLMGEELMTMGMRAMVQNKIHYRNARVPDEFLLGELGKGMDVAHDAMMYTRLAFGASFLGCIKRCLQIMHRYAGRRTAISTGRLLDNSVTLERMSTMLAWSDLLAATLQFSAQQLDLGKTIPQEMYITCKVAGSECLWQSADWAMQAMGGRGYLENNYLPQILRDARVTRVFEGPTETLLAYMGNKLLRGSAVPELIIFLQESANGHEALNLLQEAVTHSRKIISTQAKHINHLSFINGELAMWTILVAIGQHSTGVSRQTIDYGMQVLRNKTAALQSFMHNVSNLILKPDDVEQKMQALYRDIGDVEQTLPGEDVVPDRYVKRKFTHNEDTNHSAS